MKIEAEKLNTTGATAVAIGLVFGLEEDLQKQRLPDRQPL
jgi:hypothetical protein